MKTTSFREVDIIKVLDFPTMTTYCYYALY